MIIGWWNGQKYPIIFGCLNKIIYLCIRYCKRGSKVFADMAQLVEQRIRNAWVPGSSPGIGSSFHCHIMR